MEWTNKHDTLFSIEVRASDLYETRKGIPKREKLWDEFTARLNSLLHLKFNVIKRSLRDRFNLLMSKFKAKKKEEGRATGISAEMQEVDIVLEELCEKEEASKNKSTTGNKNPQQDKAKAEEMRLKAMETMGQTQKRGKKSDGVSPVKKKKKEKKKNMRCHWIPEKKKVEQEMELRRDEIELRKQEEVRGSHLSEQQVKMQQDMLKIIQQQHEKQQKEQQRHQQQQQQFMQSMFNRQQQQSQALLALIERLAPRKITNSCSRTCHIKDATLCCIIVFLLFHFSSRKKVLRLTYIKQKN